MAGLDPPPRSRSAQECGVWETHGRVETIATAALSIDPFLASLPAVAISLFVSSLPPSPI